MAIERTSFGSITIDGSLSSKAERPLKRPRRNPVTTLLQRLQYLFLLGRYNRTSLPGGQCRLQG